MKLVEDWRNGWKWVSVQAQAVAAAYVAVWLFQPQIITDALGEHGSKGALMALLVLGLGGRFVLQGFEKK
jgi:small neutral amino acid transporter SnatA (MarC family)